MVASSIAMAAALVIGGASAKAQLTNIGFDDINPSSTTYGVVPNGYDNLNWTSFDYIYRNYFPQSGYHFGTTSPDFAAFNIFGGTASVTSTTTQFNFNAVDLTSAWVPDLGGNQNLKVTIDGLLNGNLLYTSGPLTLSNTTPLLYTAPGGSFTGINQLRFTPSYSAGDAGNPGGLQFAMDDLKITRTTIPVPEPSSMTLLAVGVGLAAIARVAQRKRS